MSTVLNRRKTSLIEKAYYTFFGAGMLLGVGLVVADRLGGPDVLLGGLAVLCFGMGLIFLAWSSIQLGSAQVRFKRVYRDERPGAFWTAVALHLGAGIVMVVGAGWLLVVGG